MADGKMKRWNNQQVPKHLLPVHGEPILLRTARLVKFRKEGKEAWYSLDDDHVVKLMNQGLEHVLHG